MAMTAERRAWALLAFGVLALIGLSAAEPVLSSVNEEVSPMAERAAQPVRVTQIHFASAGRVAKYTGTIRPQHEVGLGFRVPGKIVERLVEVGDRVSQGHIIARLDDTDARLELDLAQAEVEASQVDLNRARAEQKRNQTLFAGGHVSQAVLDRANSGAAEASARADRAARALALAQNRLDYTRLVAEADGVVTATLAEPGQVVGAGQPVASVARAGAVDVVFALPEQDRDTLATSMAQAELWGGDGRTFALKLRDVSPDADPVGRTYRVRMTVLAPDEATAFGRTVTVTLESGQDRPAAPVPLAAVLNDGTGAAVWRLDASRSAVERVPIEVVAISGNVALIRGDLADGDMVASLGAHKIDPARPVRVVETYAAPET